MTVSVSVAIPPLPLQLRGETARAFAQVHEILRSRATSRRKTLGGPQFYWETMEPSAPGERPQTEQPPGRRESLDRLLPLVYDDLRAIARRQLEVRAGGGTLSPTGLVHVAYQKLAAQDGVTWKDRGHFVAIAALAMRHVLVDRAKARFAQKRGGAQEAVTLDDAVIPANEQAGILMRLSDAIDELAAVEPRLAKVIDCRFFGGFTDEEIAEALGITARTVQRDGAKARMLLRRALSE